MSKCQKCRHRKCRCIPRYQCDNVVYVDCCRKKNDKYGGCDPLEKIKTSSKKCKPVPKCQIPPFKFCLPQPGSVQNEVYFKMMEQIVDTYRKIKKDGPCNCHS